MHLHPEVAERDLADFFDNGAMPLHWVDAHGIILRANRAELELLGYERDEYVGRNIAEFHLDAGTIGDILRRLQSGETLRNYPARLRRKDGSLREVLITSNVQWGEDGRFVHTRCFTVDVTDSRRVEEERSRTADYLEGLMEGFVAYDAGWVMTYMNSAAEQLLGRQRAEVLGKTWHQAFPHAVGNPVDLLYQRVKATRKAERMEYFYAHYARWLEINAAPVRGGGVAVYFRDISDRIKAHQSLRESDERARAQVAALTKLHELALALGGMRELPQMLEATLRTVAELHGTTRGLLSLYDEESGALEVAAHLGMDEATLERVRRVTPGPDAGACGSAFTLRRRVVVEDTEREQCFLLYREVARAAGFRAVHSTPVVNRAGRILGVLSVHFDAPRRPSQLEIQLADMCARHAADAIESMRAISALERAGERLREADRRKDEFLATLAHELRTPLAPIRNGLHILAVAGPGSPAAGEARAMMERQMRHLVRLVDDLLEVARISTGRLELRREPAALSAIVKNAIEASRPLIDAGAHDLAVDLPPEEIVLDADPVRITQALANLLNNAAKYTPRKGRLRLEAHRQWDSVTLSVRDNGIGLAADMLTRVFDRHGRTEAAGDAQAGLGLGLGLAKSLVELHGGTIAAHSDGPGKGSTFTLCLPIGSPRLELNRSAAAPLAARQAAAARRVLVVDDNVDAAQSLALLIRHLGHDVRVAYGGTEALEAARGTPPDVLLLDVSMPGMDGLRVARHLRSDPRFRTLRIVALTGHGQEEDRRRSHEAGFDEHLVKPVALDTLTRVLDRP